MDTPRPLSSLVARILIATGLVAAVVTLLPFVLKLIVLTVVAGAVVYGVKRVADSLDGGASSSSARVPDAIYEPVVKRPHRPHAPAMTILATK